MPRLGLGVERGTEAGPGGREVPRLGLGKGDAEGS